MEEKDKEKKPPKKEQTPTLESIGYPVFALTLNDNWLFVGGGAGTELLFYYREILYCKC
jgi:hypothetical protein